MAEARPRALVVVWRHPVVSETFVTHHLRTLLDHGWRVSLCCAESDDALAAADDITPRLDRRTVLGPSVTAVGPLALAGRAVAERQWRVARSGVARHVARLAPALRREIRAVGPDLVHAHFGPNAAAAGHALGGTGIPLVADLHGYDLTAVPHAEGWGAYRRTLAGATLVVHSRHALDLVAEGLGRTATLVPYPPWSVEAVPDRPSAWPTPLRLLVVGRLVPEKGADVAVTALADLRRRRPELDARLNVVGDGPAAGAVRDTVARLGLGEAVTLTGALPHDRVMATLADHDVLLVPSRPGADGWVEAFGLVAAEGAAAGLGVVASRTGGLPEAAGPNAELVEPDDATALARGVEALLARTTPDALAAAASTPPPSGPGYDELSRALLTGG